MKQILRKDLLKVWGLNKSEINANGGIVVWDIPSRVHNAFNPIMFICTHYFFKDGNFKPTDEHTEEDIIRHGNDILYKAFNKTSDYTLIIKYPDKKQSELHVNLYRGVAKFNVSSFIKYEFAKRLQDFDSARTPLNDPALRYDYKVLSIADKDLTFTALNAVSQVGEIAGYESIDNHNYSKLSAWYYYDGYPLDCTLKGLRHYIGGDKQQLLVDSKSGNFVVDEYSKLSLRGQEGIRYYRCPIPHSPFYIRWINTLGGVDYYMFSHKQKRTSTIKAVQSHFIYVPDISEARGDSTVYGLDSDTSVIVGASNLNNQDYKALSEIPFSPLIEWFNEDTQKWVRLNISKYDGVDNSNTNTKEIEITFLLPTRQLQF